MVGIVERLDWWLARRRSRHRSIGSGLIASIITAAIGAIILLIIVRAIKQATLARSAYGRWFAAACSLDNFLPNSRP